MPYSTLPATPRRRLPLTIGKATLVPSLSGGESGWAVPGGGFVTDDMKAHKIVMTMNRMMAAASRG